jgi:hypothetical protein
MEKPVSLVLAGEDGMGERPEDRAQRVEKVIESRDVDKADKALQDELTNCPPEERKAFLQSLKDKNDAAKNPDWRLPHVEFSEKRTWMGMGSAIPGEFEAKVKANVLEQIGIAVRDLQESPKNPINRMFSPLTDATKELDKK